MGNNQINAAGCIAAAAGIGGLAQQGEDLNQNDDRDDDDDDDDDGNPSSSPFTYLNVGWNAINCDGLVALTTIPTLSTITNLELRRCSITDQGVMALAAEQSCLQSLVRLDLSHNQISTDGCIAIAHSPHLIKTLEFLSLASNPIESRGFDELNRVGLGPKMIKESSSSFSFF